MIVQLKLQLPGERSLPPPEVWPKLDPDARVNLIRVLAKALEKSSGATPPEAKDGEQANDGEN
jgi:hypothetical protein